MNKKHPTGKRKLLRITVNCQLWMTWGESFSQNYIVLTKDPGKWYGVKVSAFDILCSEMHIYRTLYLLCIIQELVPTKHFDWTEGIPRVTISSITAKGLLTLCITPPNRCSNHMYTPNRLSFVVVFALVCGKNRQK